MFAQFPRQALSVTTFWKHLCLGRDLPGRRECRRSGRHSRRHFWKWLQKIHRTCEMPLRTWTWSAQLAFALNSTITDRHVLHNVNIKRQNIGQFREKLNIWNVQLRYFDTFPQYLLLKYLLRFPLKNHQLVWFGKTLILSVGFHKSSSLSLVIPCLVLTTRAKLNSKSNSVFLLQTRSGRNTIAMGTKSQGLSANNTSFEGVKSRGVTA